MWSGWRFPIVQVTHRESSFSIQEKKCLYIAIRFHDITNSTSAHRLLNLMSDGRWTTKTYTRKINSITSKLIHFPICGKTCDSVDVLKRKFNSKQIRRQFIYTDFVYFIVIVHFLLIISRVSFSLSPFKMMNIWWILSVIIFLTRFLFFIVVCIFVRCHKIDLIIPYIKQVIKLTKKCVLWAQIDFLCSIDVSSISRRFLSWIHIRISLEGCRSVCVTKSAKPLKTRREFKSLICWMRI